MTTTENIPGPTAAEILTGGVTLEVTRIEGGKETANVRLLPIKLYPELGASLDDEPKLVALYTNTPAEWVDKLSRESFEQLLAEGERLNADFFARWHQRRMIRLKRMMPDAAKLVQERLRATLPTMPPASPSPAASRLPRPESTASQS